jgi:hypothetical protein
LDVPGLPTLGTLTITSHHLLFASFGPPIIFHGTSDTPNQLMMSMPFVDVLHRRQQLGESGAVSALADVLSRSCVHLSFHKK